MEALEAYELRDREGSMLKAGPLRVEQFPLSVTRKQEICLIKLLRNAFQGDSSVAGHDLRDDLGASGLDLRLVGTQEVYGSKPFFLRRAKLEAFALLWKFHMMGWHKSFVVGLLLHLGT